ncbi:uncharacterized protein N7482_001542 [Penicillium canariense]|uniref:Uncharacterized protein n=1 Tax=Penicillium canariense TaxID=189055 RepID=A0A9W9IED8_9EURO|nr:uncharacterized protein N7482_001542 [Penicillium canariense]KAJ5175665.1 hypothetical protein N7482_001542 [Penicillium canariense]
MWYRERQDIRNWNIGAAIETRPTPLCYLHLLQGGGAARDVTANATAFGYRDWDFACVVTGVWSRDQDRTELARAAVGADLGPDPRDAALAAKAFGPKRPRLARLEHISDPRNVLAYACPLPKAMKQKLIILVTGESCAGKDYCADIWVSVFISCHKSLMARAVSISDVAKREYAAATGADLTRLLQDLNGAVDVDVLLITGMRDEAPVAAMSHLVPDSRLLEVRVQASEETRRARKGCPYDDGDDNEENEDDKEWLKLEGLRLPPKSDLRQ